MRRAALSLLLVALAPSPAIAWQANGVRVTGAPFDQLAPQLAGDGMGGAFVVWSDFRSDTPPLNFSVDIYMQHVTATGQIAAGWPADGLPVVTGPGAQGADLIMPDGGGGVLIFYRDTSADDGDLYLQRITVAGTIAPGWLVGGVPVAVGPGRQGFPRLVSDGVQGAFVSWTDGVFPDNRHARYTRVLANGEIAAGWPVGGLLFEPAHVFTDAPQMLAMPGGGFLACWTASDDSLRTALMLGQRFTSQGVEDSAWPSGGVSVCPLRRSLRFPLDKLVGDGRGGFYTVFMDFRNYYPLQFYYEEDLYAQHVQSDGTIAAGWPVDGLVISAPPGLNAQAPSLCEDGQGGVYVAWEDNRLDYPQAFGLHLRPDGQRHAGWPAEGRLLSHASMFGLEPKLIPDGVGGIYLTWMELTSVGYRSFAQHLLADGSAAPGWPTDGMPVAATAGDQYQPKIVSDGSAGAIVAWGDSRAQAPSFWDIYAQRYVPGGVVAAQVSLASAAASPDEVRIRWQVSGESRASVERREIGNTAEGEWRMLTEVVADGGGYMSVVDRDVTPGSRYSYRLAFASGARGGEVAVDVPVRLTLELEGARPNPAVGALWLAFTLPDATPARLELFDLAGRRLVARQVGSAGRHVVRMDDGALAPGLYWAALTQGARTLRTRVAMMK